MQDKNYVFNSNLYSIAKQYWEVLQHVCLLNDFFV